MLSSVTRGRLTRHELSWLLTQEAQGAAVRLRDGVLALKAQAPSGEAEVEPTLDALDDAMRTLAKLHRAPMQSARRGRIDVSALACDLFPQARISIEPGDGLDVWAEDADLRRVIYVLLGDEHQREVRICRAGQFVKIEVTLGPDASPRADAERGWLSRMAIWYGGELLIEGSIEVLSLPAAVDPPEMQAGIDVDEFPTSPNLQTINGARVDRLSAFARFSARIGEALATTDAGNMPLVQGLLRFGQLDFTAPRVSIDLLAAAEAASTELGKRGLSVKCNLRCPISLYAPAEPLRLFIYAVLAQAALASPATATWEMSAGAEFVTLIVTDSGQLSGRFARAGEAGMWLQMARELAPWIGAQLEASGRGDFVTLTARFSFS